MPIGATQLATASKTRIFVQLNVYNYDASPRGQYLEHNCRSVAHAKQTADRLRRMVNTNVSANRTGRWLDNNYAINGFIERVSGIFHEVTTRIE
jgi:hypothetical protein